MNRDMKCRAWDKQHKRMVEVTMILFDTGEIDYKGNLNEPVSMEHFDLMWFTGLKDKKGQDIYEGDVITFAGHFGARVFIDPYRGVCVRYLSDNARTDLIESYEEPMPRNHGITVEVVSNIYEEGRP